ncbi:MAG: hypothetical protein QOF58_7335 [Pseudonocardiales bacterium]|jgi:hypothetical protein|nr:hypothetical protein [Pseudonocardiales bacterium]
MHAEALHNTGQLEAAECVLVDATKQTESEPQDDVDRRNLRIRALMALAAVRYDSGDYRGHWTAVKQCLDLGAEMSGLPLETELALQLYRVAVDPKTSPDASRRLAALRDTQKLSDEQITVLDLAQVEIHLMVVRSSPAQRARAEVSARELVSRLKQAAPLLTRPGRAHLALAQAAYVSALVDDDDIAREVLGRIGDSGDWREETLRAMLYVRASQPAKACEILGQVVTARHHDIDRRCLHGQATLAAGNVSAALRDAEAVARFAPNHVAGRLLHADALYVAAKEMSEDSAEHYLNLIEATAGYAHVLRLDHGLSDFLADRPSDRPVGSEPLPSDTVKHVARRCVAAAISATHALARSGLPADKSVHRDARFALKQLKPHDKHDARRLRRMLWQPRRRWLKYWLVRGGSGVLGVGLLLLAGFDNSFLDQFGAPPTPRLVTGLLGLLSLLWPYISKFSVGPVSVERAESQASVAVLATQLPLSPVGFRLSPPPPIGSLTGRSGPQGPTGPDANKGARESVSAKGDAGRSSGLEGVTVS